MRIKENTNTCFKSFKAFAEQLTIKDVVLKNKVGEEAKNEIDKLKKYKKRWRKIMIIYIKLIY